MTTSTPDRPGAIHARPVRHPGRWLAVAIIAILTAMLVNSFVTNPNWDFPFAFEIAQQKPVIEGLWIGTILGTVGAMILGVALGVILAVMRLSDNFVLRGVAFVYTWFFRAMPRYVLLAFMGGAIALLYRRIDIGVPFGKELSSALGLSTDLTFFSFSWNDINSSVLVGIIGLGLSEAAYMAEIARAGILSVDKGQTEAAQALGMAPGKTMRRIVLPQAMRVIVPPTGNETIAMVKDTSLFIAASVITELYFQAYLFGQRSFNIVPGFVAAILWYLVVCSVLMVGQSYLEKYYGRGFGTPKYKKAAKEKIMTIEAGH
jgi:polar amino acid transport system permease protein